MSQNYRPLVAALQPVDAGADGLTAAVGSYDSGSSGTVDESVRDLVDDSGLDDQRCWASCASYRFRKGRGWKICGAVTLLSSALLALSFSNQPRKSQVWRGHASGAAHTEKFSALFSSKDVARGEPRTMKGNHSKPEDPCRLLVTEDGGRTLMDKKPCEAMLARTDTAGDVHDSRTPKAVGHRGEGEGAEVDKLTAKMAELKEQLTSVQKQLRYATAAINAAAAAANSLRGTTAAALATTATTTAATTAITIATSTATTTATTTATQEPLVSTTTSLPKSTTTALLNATNAAKHRHLPSLFCFAVARTKGYEVELVKAQLGKGVGIFGCNDYLVLSHPAMTLGPDPSGGPTVRSKNIPDKTKEHVGHFGVNGQLTNSWLNTLTFLSAWEAIREDGRLWDYDWTVKADPDAVLLPSRLRSVLAPHTPHGGGVEYLLNCNRWPTNPLLYGAVEVFSKKAVGAYYDGVARCKTDLPWQGFGEDLFMQKCMDMIGVKSVGEFDMVSDTNCKASSCTDDGKAAFHPFKSPATWFDCWGQATQLRL